MSRAADLGHVRWIGGSSGAGKSTIARRLAERHGLDLYATDAVMTDHARRTPPDEAPLLTTFSATSMDERWVDRSPRTMLETFHWFRGEAFDCIVDDLARTDGGRVVVAEGLRLLPSLVAPHLDERRRAVWLLPTPAVRRAVFEGRGPEWGFLPRTSDPTKALANLLERDALFTDRLAAETRRLGLTSVTVDGSRTEEEVSDEVADALVLGAR